MRKILLASFLTLLFIIPIFAEDTSLTYTDAQGDVFYFEDLQDPIDLKSQTSVNEHPEVDIIGVNYNFDRSNNSLHVVVEFFATPILDADHSYIVDLNYFPLPGEDLYSPIEMVGVGVGWNRQGNMSFASTNFRTVTTENSSYIPNVVEIQGNSLIYDFPLASNFPMTELFDESTTYHDIVIDTQFYVEGAGAYGPVYMDRMEIIPEDVESDDDNDEDLLGELPVSLWFIIGILTIPILRKKFTSQ
ncbi:MAG: hypothetical protein HeimC2_01250 [Candidatus Heimdallarchaeota archaeon LC_2]|nr:MAG: hypothetical protein HeimC2_01250 [Candidatus Heimdallarchaeota archaeon LC_2]